MYSYIFILGRNFLLSSAEIFSVLHALNISYTYKGNSEEVFLIDTKEPLNITLLQDSLGGTIEIGELENIVTRDIARRIKKEKDLIRANLSEKEVVIGKRLAQQDIDAFTHREFDKPYIDAKSGQLSVKLALMMVNLATKTNTSCIYDPFCGGGSINVEAIRLGFNTIGSDVSHNAIIGSRKNMDWYRKEIHNKEIPFPSFHFFKSDIQYASNEIRERGYEIDAVVTEGYLGRPRTRPIENVKADQNDLKEISTLIERSLVEYKKFLKPGDRVITVIPAYRGRKETYFLPIRDKLTDLGYNTVDLFDKDFDFLGKRKQFLIYRRGSFVLRQIFVLENT